MEKGWDPEIKKFFLKIAKSVSLGLSWLIACIAAGFYFKLAYTGEGTSLAGVVIFYTLLVLTLVLLVLYLYRLWKK